DSGVEDGEQDEASAAGWWMTAPAPIAEVRDYDGLVSALCLRVDQLGISYKTLEAVSGLADGHAGKLLGDGQVKILGPTSMGLVLQGLAVKLLVVEDVEAARKMESRWEKCRPELRRKR